jgi:hypothetical protein
MQEGGPEDSLPLLQSDKPLSLPSETAGVFPNCERGLLSLFDRVICTVSFTVAA